MARYRATVAYDGTHYQGFQRIPGRATIQGALETALERLSGAQRQVLGAGRTDAGVHATGQVIAFDLEWKHSNAELLRALNATLPIDIALQALEQAPPDFHPRYAARSRAYRYLVYTVPTRQPVLDYLAWWVRDDLDVARMNEAAALLLGAHDFASFGTPPRGEQGTTHREVYRSVWVAEPPLAGYHEVYALRTLAYTIEANAFLYKMVRTIVGALVEIGSGRLTQSAFLKIFESGERLTRLAPPHGLTLVAVRYDGNTSGETPAGTY